MFQGINVPCIGDSEPVYKARNGSNSTQADYAEWHLAKILNAGHRSAAQDSELTVRIIYQILDHPLNVADTLLWMTVGWQFQYDRIWVGQISTTVHNDTDQLCQVSSNMSYHLKCDVTAILKFWYLYLNCIRKHVRISCFFMFLFLLTPAMI